MSSTSHRKMDKRSILIGHGSRRTDETRYAEESEHLMEQQNDEMIGDLHSKVIELKGITMDINQRIKEDNEFIDSTADVYESTGFSLSKATQRIGVMLDSWGYKHMCYLCCFIVGFFFLCLWLIMKRR
eukprot:TRINITY_DN1029_c0_g2_i1.p1 TRINITY_DN1029_c0_g2~~TRINITY_DN1029_c0_g2_i1.p1  ORF type:complete len:128 (-),score=25.32 TRINITY_DN1029_c0_g2_i1:54-437(-)